MNYELQKEESEKILYRRFYGIKDRCYNKNTPKYKYYGEKCVRICQKWLDNPDSFIKWSLENGFKKELEIDKDILCKKLNIEPKIYSPETCLWVDKKTNKQNKSDSRIIKYKGKKQSLQKWCEELNLNRISVSNRINKLDWSIKDAFEIPFKKERTLLQYTKDMEFVCLYESGIKASKETGISRTSITNCLKGTSKTAGGYIWKYANNNERRG